MLAKLIHWAFIAINTFNPADSPKYGLAKETPAEATARYLSIADDAVSVVFDEQERPLYSDELGREKTLATLLAVLQYESGGFRKDVDEGTTRGDHGHSYCLAQIHLRGTRIVVKSDGLFDYSQTEGWSGQDLASDRRKCFRAALAMMRASFACGGPERGKLRSYASGRCDAGMRESSHRMNLAKKLFDDLKPLL